LATMGVPFDHSESAQRRTHIRFSRLLATWKCKISPIFRAFPTGMLKKPASGRNL
jgi:hypothetical protein